MRKTTFDYENHYQMKKNRLKALEATEYKCAICGGDADRVHHKDGSKSNHAVDNLLPVCNRCHMMIHAADRVRWNVERINVAMMQRGFDVSDLAEKTGLTQAAIRHVLQTGTTKNSTMKRIADALEYPIEVFFASGNAEKLKQLESKAAETSLIRRAIDEKLKSVKDPILKRRFHTWISRDLREKFNVNSYYNIPEDMTTEAIDFIKNWRNELIENALPKTGTE